MRISKSPFLGAVYLIWFGLASLTFGLAQGLFHDVWPLSQTFIRWDAGWYISIAHSGYYPGNMATWHLGQANQVFFPLYPLLIAAIHAVTQLPLLVVGVGISLVSFLIALVFFYDLVARRYDEATARWATLLLSFNPFAMFFGLVYTESLFLLLSVLAFWFLQDRRSYWWAAAVAGLASATRATGVFLGLVVVAHWAWTYRQHWLKEGRRWRHLARFIGLTALSLSGIAAYAIYLQYHNHDALAFVQLQRYWGRAGVQTLIPEVRDKISLLVHHRGSYFYNLLPYVIWYAATAVGLIGLTLLIRQREYWFALYVALSVLLPLMSGTIGSMNRYVMVEFPLYIAFVRAFRLRGRTIMAAVSVIGFCAMWWLYLAPSHLFFG